MKPKHSVHLRQRGSARNPNITFGIHTICKQVPLVDATCSTLTVSRPKKSLPIADSRPVRPFSRRVFDGVRPSAVSHSDGRPKRKLQYRVAICSGGVLKEKRSMACAGHDDALLLRYPLRFAPLQLSNRCGVLVQSEAPTRERRFDAWWMHFSN